jgi:hypothetical protein
MIDVYKIINKKQSKLMKEDFEDDLMSFEMPEMDEYDDLENQNDYTEEDEFTEELNDDVSQELEDIEDSDENQSSSDEGDIIKNKKLGTALVKILRDEISSKKEYERDFLRFRYRGEICDGIPMAEINPSRFVFKIDNILKAINLSEIKIL